MNKRGTNRRNFLQQAGMVSLGFLGLQTFLITSCQDSSTSSTEESLFYDKYGTLVEDPEQIIKLPKGFTYKIIGRKGQRMSDGLLQPDKPDGMATFAGSNGRIILVRNHELMPTNFGAFGSNNELMQQVDRSKIYDFRKGNLPCTGGTTTLVINEDTLEVEKSWLSLAGTLRNCAGGPTPWGTWVSCEEIVLPTGRNGYAKGHGYNFEVPATEEMSLAEPIPLKAMGQFNHEAICVDPRTGIVYQTEDAEDGLIYRFIPNEKGNLANGGRLQALAIKGQKSVSTRNWRGDKGTFTPNKKIAVEWIDMPDAEDVPDDDLRIRGFKNGATKFARGEGMWFGNNEVYFACTSGGRSKTGQIFRYLPSTDEGTPAETNNPGQLELFLEPNDTDLLKYCDNLTVAPWGDIVLCEDRKHPRVVGVTKEGNVYHLAESVYLESEFAGGVFSPSGKTYFVNIQHAGLTLAIQGPWKEGSSKAS